MKVNGAVSEMQKTMIELCIASHHSGLINILDPDGIDNLGNRLHKTGAGTSYAEITKGRDFSAQSEVSECLNSEVLRAEGQRLIERLRSNCKSHCDFYLALYTRFILSCLIDADCLDAEQFSNPQSSAYRQEAAGIDWSGAIVQLEGALINMSGAGPLNEERKRLSDRCKQAADRETGAYDLCIPTGGGKTLSSLRFALYHARRNHLKHIYYIVPYNSIIDQNVKVVRDALGQAYVEKVVEFHADIVKTEDTELSRILAENWDVPIVFTSAVQFLDTFYGKGSRKTRRMHNLADSVFIFDEAQAIPRKCVRLFNGAVNFLTQFCHSTVVVCTATQPIFDHVGDFDMIFSSDRHLIDPAQIDSKVFRRTVAFNLEKDAGWSYDEIAAAAIDQYRGGLSVLIILNTRDDAREVFARVNEKIQNSRHLSTRMCPAHRTKVLQAIREDLAANRKLICVSTQLVEAGVDLDFDTVFRATAGLDSLVQAAGRCNRNGRRTCGEVRMINVRGSFLPAEIKDEAETTDQVLREKVEEDILSDEMLTHYYQYYYYKNQDKLDYHMGSEDAVRLLEKNRTARYEYLNKNNGQKYSRSMAQAFDTVGKEFRVIDDDAIGIIVPYEESNNLVGRLRVELKVAEQGSDGHAQSLLRQAQRYTVPIYARDLKKMKDAGEIAEIVPGCGIYYLDVGSYDQHLGLITE